jgi:hypothetical protein
MAFVEDAHADTVEKFGPLNPYLIEIWPPAMSLIIFGIKKGLKRGVPSPSTNPFIACRKVSIPPIPDAHITPTLSLLTVLRSIPESAIASSAAIIAN